MMNFLGFLLGGDSGICVAAVYYAVSNSLMGLYAINCYFLLACGFQQYVRELLKSFNYIVQRQYFKNGIMI